ncbi:MAG TPA: hypothetical protein PLD49_04430, partial [Thermoclostridium caenicola]|nr:hypothetical protein [Thermoclostridium caenicola]
GKGRLLFERSEFSRPPFEQLLFCSRAAQRPGFTGSLHAEKGTRMLNRRCAAITAPVHAFTYQTDVC